MIKPPVNGVLNPRHLAVKPVDIVDDQAAELCFDVIGKIIINRGQISFFYKSGGVAVLQTKQIRRLIAFISIGRRFKKRSEVNSLSMDRILYSVPRRGIRAFRTTFLLKTPVFMYPSCNTYNILKLGTFRWIYFRSNTLCSIFRIHLFRYLRGSRC
jgi:hypothetical protein